MTEQIIYEQPLNELVRVSLRLEHLFKQIDEYFADDRCGNYTNSIVDLILHVVQLLDRPDLKSKLGKEFHRYYINFSRLQNTPDISKETLDETLHKLRESTNAFFHSKGKIAQNLRNNEFLQNIAQNLYASGCDSCSDIPGYHYWLQQPEKQRIENMKNWLKEFKEIRSAIKLLLDIIRNSSEATCCTAECGFYHQILDRKLPCQLLRVVLPKNLILYPEISAGKHRVSIRFVIPNICGKITQTREDVKFKLTVCVI